MLAEHGCQHHERCCRLLGHIRLWAGPFNSASCADLLAVRIVLSLVGLHLAELATREIMADVTMHCHAQSGISRQFQTVDQIKLQAPDQIRRQRESALRVGLNLKRS